MPDGCGAVLSCGSCGDGESCGGGGNANVCGGGDACIPTTCEAEGMTCGAISDGCGATLDCGACAAGATCSENICVTSGGDGGTCTPTNCAAVGATCGELTDGCGGTLSCGSCSSGETCGGGGTPNQCGGGQCVKETCGDRCGAQPDGCGGTLDCGTCCEETSTETFTAALDYYARADEPDATFGAEPSLLVGGSPEIVTYFSFFFRPAEVIRSARIQLWVTDESASKLELGYVDLYNWGDVRSWNERPPVGVDLTSDASPVRGTWFEFDVTGVANSYEPDPNFPQQTIAFCVSTQSSDAAEFAAVEAGAATAPRLVVVYENACPAP